MAEKVGFEPTVQQNCTTVFETAPFDRSGISPQTETTMIFYKTNEYIIYSFKENQTKYSNLTEL